MSTYQSFQSNTAAGSNSVIITKPVGLAVGDLMLAHISAHRNNGGTIALVQPGGWTLEENTTDSAFYSDMSVYSKIADAADVAAANFTFTSSGGSAPSIGGHLIRFTNYGLKAGERSNSQNTAIATLTGTTFTPTLPNTTFVFFAATHCNAGVSTLNTYALATDNPTWTERSELAINTANYDSQISFATATRAQATATGTITLTKSNANASQDNMIVLALAPVVNGSITPGNTRAIAYNFAPVQSARTNVRLDAPVVNASTPAIWNNEADASTVWVNETY